MPSYSFLTTWCLDAPRERVWDAIWESERWPEWWRGVIRAEKLIEGDETGVGQVGALSPAQGWPVYSTPYQQEGLPVYDLPASVLQTLAS